MIKIAFVMPKLTGGGAERVVSTIIRHLNKRDFLINLILIQGGGEYEKDLPKEVRVTVLPVNKLRYAAPSLIKTIREYRPNIIFSSIRGMSILLSIIKPFFPKDTILIFREMNSPSESLKYTSNKWLLKFIYRTIYKSADKIVCQSQYMLNDFLTNLNYPKRKLIHIYNPIDIELVNKLKEEGSSPFKNNNALNVVSVGRLSRQKWYEQLIDSLYIAKQKKLNIKVWILGEGPLEKYLKLYAQKKNVADILEFVGRQKNPYRWMRHADLFILHSRYEGLPNVLLEAITCKCPPIVTNHPGGTIEIMTIANLQDRVVEELIWNNDWFKEISTDSVKRIKNTFNVNKIIEEYERLFRSLTRAY